jgi:hypothetical protein
MIRPLYRRLLACIATGVVPVGVSCSSPPDSAQADRGASEDTTGTVAMNLDVATGVSIDSASYSITGPNGFTRSGSIDLSHSSTLSAIISGLPAGNGFNISITATSSDGAVSCAGSTSFAVTASATTVVNLHLDCHEGTHQGSILVNGTLNICPVVDGVGANPTDAIVGTGIHLNGDAHDTDSGPGALTYAWTATSGVFSSPSAQNPLFTCTVPGPSTITLTVTDGDPVPTCADNLSVTVDCAAAPPRPYSWVELGSAGAVLARVVTPDLTCPSIELDGHSQPMSVRIASGTAPARTSTASPVKPSAFPVTTCETTIPAGTGSARVLGANLPLPKANPTKIVIIGDTGCRLKTGNPWQACSDETAWPFRLVADAAAAQHPDLVLHVGDYHYRENACPPDVTGCQGSPWSYGWDAWEADLFRPAETLLHAAPWVVVRGNHEECLRAGQGWFRFLDTRAYAADHSCDDPANDAIANYNDPYAVPVGSDTQVIVFDTSRSTAAALDPSNATDGPIFTTYQNQLRQVETLAADPNVFSVFANHHPLLGYAPTTGNPAGGQASLLSVMNATYPGAYYPPNIKAAFHGHVHLFEAIDFSTPHPPTFVSGMGGDNIDAALPDPFPFSVQPAAGVTPDQISHDNAFGFMTMERGTDGKWTYKSFRVDGTLMTSCQMLAGDKISCSPQGYLH